MIDKHFCEIVLKINKNEFYNALIIATEKSD